MVKTETVTIMRIYLLLLLLLATRLTAQVELPDLRVQNPGGTVVEIHDVRLLHVDPDGIRVLHSAGTAKVPFEMLPDDLQSKYGFNAHKAKQHREVVAAAQQSAAMEAVVAQSQAQAQARTQSTPVMPPSSYTASASGTRTSLGYTLPAVGNFRSSSSYSTSRSRYNSYCPSCCGYSYSYSYVPVYYYPTSSCGTSTSTSSGTVSVGR